jgi:hypothetical protein
MRGNGIMRGESAYVSTGEKVSSFGNSIQIAFGRELTNASERNFDLIQIMG